MFLGPKRDPERQDAVQRIVKVGVSVHKGARNSAISTTVVSGHGRKYFGWTPPGCDAPLATRTVPVSVPVRSRIREAFGFSALPTAEEF